MYFDPKHQVYKVEERGGEGGGEGEKGREERHREGPQCAGNSVYLSFSSPRDTVERLCLPISFGRDTQ